jgi:hypothetical protein
VHGIENMHRVGAQIPGVQLPVIGEISRKPMQYKAIE